MATLSGCFEISYKLGWLRASTVDRLDNFRKIRNIFAHEAFKVSFAEGRVNRLFKPLLNDLEKFDSTALEAALKVAKEIQIDRYASASEDKRFLACLALLVGTVFEDFLVLPASKAHRVSAHDLARGEGRPKVLFEVYRNQLQAIVDILQIDRPLT